MVVRRVSKRKGERRHPRRRSARGKCDRAGRVLETVGRDKHSERATTVGVIATITARAAARLRDVVFTPHVGLEEDAIDLLEVDDFGSVADGLEQRRDVAT
jgi:hypothetical protein